MKVTLLQQDLYPSLQSVARSIGVKNTLPVLANILIQAENNKLKLSATNLEIGVIKTINANIEEEGEITVPARTLLEIISPLSNTEIILEASQDQLKITTSNFNATLNGIVATEFPTIPFAGEESIQIDSQVIFNSLPQISFAAAVDEGRPILTGILTEIKDNSLELVATDGFRLAHKTTSAQALTKKTFKALIPRRTFEEVVRLISEENTDSNTLQISTSENQNQMIFTIGQTNLSSRLIEGSYPSWERIIPQTFENKTTVDRQTLLRFVKLASVFAKDVANIVKIEVAENKLKISSEAKELGEQHTELDVLAEGTPISIAFNSKFLQEALNNAGSEQITINFSGNLSPALIKPIPDNGLEYVIMPIRLS